MNGFLILSCNDCIRNWLLNSFLVLIRQIAVCRPALQSTVYTKMSNTYPIREFHKNTPLKFTQDSSAIHIFLYTFWRN